MISTTTNCDGTQHQLSGSLLAFTCIQSLNMGAWVSNLKPIMNTVLLLQLRKIESGAPFEKRGSGGSYPVYIEEHVP